MTIDKLENIIQDFENYFYTVFQLNINNLNQYDKVLCMEKLAYIDLQFVNYKRQNKGIKIKFNIKYKLLVNKFYLCIQDYNNSVEEKFKFMPLTTNKNFITRIKKAYKKTKYNLLSNINTDKVDTIVKIDTNSKVDTIVKIDTNEKFDTNENKTINQRKISKGRKHKKPKIYIEETSNLNCEKDSTEMQEIYLDEQNAFEPNSFENEHEMKKIEHEPSIPKRKRKLFCCVL